MLGNNTRYLITNLLLAWRYTWRRRGLWLRALLSLGIGAVFIAADRDHDYDNRFKLRGAQAYSPDIVLIQINREEWSNVQKNLGAPPQLPSSTSFADGFYWNETVWQQLLEKILVQDPKAIGVSLFFGANIESPSEEARISPIFRNSKVFWATIADRDGHVLPTRFARNPNRNSALGEYEPDRDGIIRRVTKQKTAVPHLAFQIAKQSHLTDKLPKADFDGSIINFRGANGTFPTVSLTEALSPRFPSDYFKGKIVLIGGDDALRPYYRTPVGDMNLSEVTANVLDNILADRWIDRAGIAIIFLVLLFFTVLTALVTSYYPQFFALFVLFSVNVIYSVFSIWIFDTFNFWLPVLVPIIVTGITYITFLSFQLTLKDYLNLQLEKEREFMLDVEQLKNNFLSLISHDLKTPIAKIQGICDRLLTEYSEPRLQSDLVSLRETSSELNRYIRTILQIAKVESRDFRLHTDAVDVNELTETVIHQLEPLSKAKNIGLRADLEPMFLVEVDPILIQEVILNLIENAIKYTPDGGRILVSTSEVDGHIILVVEDTGPGIPAEEQSRIFEKFYRGESGKSQARGSGLGLYLVKYFIELHGGRVILESAVGKGTKIGFSLPISDEQKVASDTAVTATETPPAPISATGDPA